VVFDAEKLLMSNSCEIKWAVDNNSFNNKKINFIKNAFNQTASFFSFREDLVSHCPSGHSLNPPLGLVSVLYLSMNYNGNNNNNNNPRTIFIVLSS